MDDAIRTERLLLRGLRASDAEPLFALFANWEVIRWLSSPPWPYTLADAKSFVGQHRDRTTNDGAAELAIVLDGRLIGCIGVTIWPARPLQRGAGPYLGYWLGEPYWRRGLMTEAATGVVRHVFTTRTTDAIYSGAHAENAASLCVQEKLGFVRDGETMLHFKPRRGDYAHVNTVLTRNTFGAHGA